MSITDVSQLPPLPEDQLEMKLINVVKMVGQKSLVHRHWGSKSIGDDVLALSSWIWACHSGEVLVVHPTAHIDFEKSAISHRLEYKPKYQVEWVYDTLQQFYVDNHGLILEHPRAPVLNNYADLYPIELIYVRINKDELKRIEKK